MRVAYFTGGNIGAGHLVRGVAIGRGLARAGFRGSYAMFGPQLPFPAARRNDYTALELPPDVLQDPQRAPSSALAQALRAFQPDLLIADLFWAPLRHVLPSLGVEAWLLARKVPAAWFQGPPGLPFVREQFARVLAIEPCDVPVAHERIEPIVVCNPEEQKPPEALRERLGVALDARLELVVHAGQPGELAQLRQGASAEAVALDLFEPSAPFPLAEWLRGVDLLHAAAGYNAFWESRWLGVPARFTPLPRRLDDQAWRVRTCSAQVPGENGADALAKMILGRTGGNLRA